MIITKRTALSLIRCGMAQDDGRVFHDGATYAIITRFDFQRVDHYLIGYGDLRACV